METNFKILMTLMGLEIGGAETHVVELCKKLKKMGVDVYVASNGGAYVEEITEAGIKHFYVPLHNKNPFNFIKSYFDLKKIIKENNINLVHAHARIPGFICGLLKKKLKFKFVTTCHGVYSTKLHFKMLSNWGEKTLAVSEDIKKYLMTNYQIKDENIFVTINGIDAEKFSKSTDYSSIIEEFNLDMRKKRIVYVSRLDVEVSAVAHNILECVESLYKKDKNIEFFIVGDGSDYNAIKKKVVEINKKLGERVIILTGARKDINKLVACGDFFIGISRAALEAMSVEKPVILAGAPGYIGIFNENKLEIATKTNFCCRDCEKVTSKQLEIDISYLLSATKEELQSYGIFSREIVKKYYSLDKMSDDALDLYEKVRQSTRKTDVIISGYYGFRNDGDDAILKSILEGLKDEQPHIKIIVLSKRPKETMEIHNTETINRVNFYKIWHCLKDTKVLISGGGTLVQDLTSTQSLVYYLTIMWLAKKLGAKNMLYSNGIGPITTRNNWKLSTKMLDQVDLITVRDEESLKVLKEMNIKRPKCILTADPVFNYNSKQNRGKILLKEFGLMKNNFFIVSIRNWKFLKLDFTDNMAKFCDSVSEKYGLVPLFIPMQLSNDTEISKMAISKMKSKGYFLETDHTTDDLIEIIGESKFLVAMRLHSIIYSIKANTPVIGLVYDPKVENMMRAIKQETFMDVEAIDVDMLMNFTADIINNSEKIMKEIKEFDLLAKEKAILNNHLAIELINRKEF